MASEFESKFKVSGHLGDGAYGSVYKVKNKMDWREYAVKRILVRRYDKDAKRALREAKSLALISHPGIVKYNHAWMESGFLYIQMELCQSSLADWLSKNQVRDLSKMKNWFAQLVLAVMYIHETGKIHRDLKPTNILFASENHLKVCDFGEITDISIADSKDGGVAGPVSEQSSRSEYRGTPMYMAPEQRNRWKDIIIYSNKVDIFALGLILAELFLVMTLEEKKQAFAKYQNGEMCSILEERLLKIGMIEIFKWMTNFVDGDRPDCREILEHPSLKEHSPKSDSPQNTNSQSQTFSTLSEDTMKDFERSIASEIENIMKEMREYDEEFDSEFFKKFIPRKIISKGRYGTVFEARNIIDETLYAVKRIAVRARVAEMYFNEVRSFASLNHERIVSYNSCWMEATHRNWQSYANFLLMSRVFRQQKAYTRYNSDYRFIYIQMELCMCNLSQWLRENESRDLTRAKKWFKQIVSGVEFIHKNEKIHRDLKPSNILIDKYGDLKIGDLGIITESAAPDDQTLINSAVNEEKYLLDRPFSILTKMYAARELQYFWDGYSSKVDIFALGLILFELCVQASMDKKLEVFENYRRGEPNDALDHLPEVKEFIAWLTNIDPKERPNCEEILMHPFLD